MQTGRVTILRFNPETDLKPHFEEYEFPFEPGMTVLDVAFHIYENIDGSFSFSYCCRNSHCGLCGAKINGRPGLMCRESATPELRLEPLDNLPVIRDLVVEREEYERRKEGLRLFLDRVSRPEAEPEQVDTAAHDRFKVASRCVECYSCLSGCPAFRENQHEYLGPAGMVQMARHAFDPRDELSRGVEAYGEGLYNCTTCGKCTEVCPHGVAPSENIELLRELLVTTGPVPAPVSQLQVMVRETGRAVLPPKGKSFLQWYGGPRSGAVGLFVGCNIDCDPRLMPVATAAAETLTEMGVDVAVPREQVCCGAPLKEVGAAGNASDVVRKNVEVFEKAGCTTLVTLCSGCGLGLKTLWPEILSRSGQKMPFEVMDFSEYVVSHGLEPEGLYGFKMKVTYHDPCTLRRGQKVFEEPRRVLRSISGVTYRELPESDYCCGGGGGLRASNFPLSQRILSRKVSFMRDMEVDALVTSCPTCMKQFQMGLSRAGLRGIEVLHPAVVIARAMGLS